MKRKLSLVLFLVAAIVLLPGFSSNIPDVGIPLGCRQVATNTVQCEFAVDWTALAASTTTPIFAYDIGANDQSDFYATIDVMVPGSVLSTGHAWWVRTFRGSMISGTFTDPSGGTSDTASASSVGSLLSGATAALVQVGSQMQVQVNCPVACAASASVSIKRGAFPQAVLSISPTTIIPTIATPTLVTITGTPGFGQALNNGSSGLLNSLKSIFATNAPPSVAGIPLTGCSTPSLTSTTVTCTIPPAPSGGYTVGAGDVFIASTVLPLVGGFSVNSATPPTLSALAAPFVTGTAGTPGGAASLTLNGTTLATVTAVNFGAPCSTSVAPLTTASTSLTFKLPGSLPAASQCPITVTNPGGTSAAANVTASSSTNAVIVLPSTTVYAFVSWSGFAAGAWTDLVNNITTAGLGSGVTSTSNYINGLAAMTFAGAGCLQTTASFSALNQPNTVYMVMDSSVSATEVFWSDVTTVFQSYQVSASGQITTNPGTTGVSITQSPASAHLYTEVQNGASSSIAVDNGSPVTGGSGTTNLTRLDLGCSGAGSNFMTGHMMMWIIETGAASAGDKNFIHTALAQGVLGLP